jgi:1-acyl-sn-glycerol-3-phosphate acyltransferase
LLYNLLKIPAAISFWMYCRQLRVNNKDYFNSKGPLLIACNHPDSFLDAIVISSLFKRPVYSLARGDVFKNKLVAKILGSLKMLPVYRTSEGVQNMEHNYSTFNACKDIFKKNGIVLIFSEGRCVNEWKLRPLMKGTARLAISSWEDGIDLKILPAGINYQSFTVFGKNIHLNFGEMITRADVDLDNGFGRSLGSFNQQLQFRLEPLVYKIDKKDIVTLHERFAVPVAHSIKILLAVPAAAGYLLHFPLTYPAKKIAAKFGGHNDHYDSMLVGLLFLAYPFYLLIFCFLFYKIDHHYWWVALPLLPVLGYCYMQIKKQF